MRIGAFSLDSSVAFLTEKLIAPMNLSDSDAQKAVETDGFCILNNVKTGIWIAGTSHFLALLLLRGFKYGIHFDRFVFLFAQIFSLFAVQSVTSTHVMVSEV